MYASLNTVMIVLAKKAVRMTKVCSRSVFYITIIMLFVGIVIIMQSYIRR